MDESNHQSALSRVLPPCKKRIKKQTRRSNQVEEVEEEVEEGSVDASRYGHPSWLVQSSQSSNRVADWNCPRSLFNPWKARPWPDARPPLMPKWPKAENTPEPPILTLRLSFQD